MTFEEVQRICRDIQVKDRTIRVGRNHTVFIQIEYTQRCVNDGDAQVQRGRKWFVSSYATRSEVVQTVFKAALTSAEHEVREHFTYRGRAVYGPHFDVEKLWELAGEEKDKRL